MGLTIPAMQEMYCLLTHCLAAVVIMCIGKSILSILYFMVFITRSVVGNNTFICMYVRFGHAITQVVICSHLTVEVQAQSWASLCQICGGQGATGTSFPLDISVFSFHQCLMFIFHLKISPIRRISNQNLLSQMSGCNGQTSTVTVFGIRYVAGMTYYL
jgi:hypothetical protein